MVIGKERKGKERNAKERKGKEKKGKERKIKLPPQNPKHYPSKLIIINTSYSDCPTHF